MGIECHVARSEYKWSRHWGYVPKVGDSEHEGRSFWSVATRRGTPRKRRATGRLSACHCRGKWLKDDETTTRETGLLGVEVCAQTTRKNTPNFLRQLLGHEVPDTSRNLPRYCVIYATLNRCCIAFQKSSLRFGSLEWKYSQIQPVDLLPSYPSTLIHSSVQITKIQSTYLLEIFLHVCSSNYIKHFGKQTGD